MNTSAFNVNSAIPLDNDNYYSFLFDAVNRSRKALWASVFIIDMRIREDVDLQVRQILELVSYAHWRGVDVRILLGLSDIRDIHNANLTTAFFLDSNEVPVRLFQSTRKSGTHSKYMLVDDDMLILGSHNWTHNAFFNHMNSSLAVESPDMAYSLRQRFITNWEHARSLSEYEL